MENETAVIEPEVAAPVVEKTFEEARTEAVAKIAELTADAPVQPPADEAGKEGEGTSAEPPAGEVPPPETPEIPAELLTQAEDAGISKEDAAAFGIEGTKRAIALHDRQLAAWGKATEPTPEVKTEPVTPAPAAETDAEAEARFKAMEDEGAPPSMVKFAREQHAQNAELKKQLAGFEETKAQAKAAFEEAQERGAQKLNAQFHETLNNLPELAHVLGDAKKPNAEKRAAVSDMTRDLLNAEIKRLENAKTPLPEIQRRIIEGLPKLIQRAAHAVCFDAPKAPPKVEKKPHPDATTKFVPRPPQRTQMQPAKTDVQVREQGIARIAAVRNAK